MSHVMIDLETLSTKPDAAILEIGAVEFDIGGGGLSDKPNTFYRAIEVNDAIKYGSVSGDTLVWWASQGKEAREAAFQGERVPLFVALFDFSNWLRNTGLRDIANAGDVLDGPRMWGNGAGFDNVILEHAYTVAGMEVPWMFWQNACYRTVCALLGGHTEWEFAGTEHYALDDAVAQAIHLQKVLRGKL